MIHAVLVYKKGSRYYEKIVSIKKIINPVKTIIMPRSRGTKDRNALVIDRNVPIIKQNIAKMVLNVTSSGSGASLIFINVLLSVFYYIKLNYPYGEKFPANATFCDNCGKKREG